MIFSDDPVKEHQQLSVKSALIRTEAIRTQMRAVRTFCDLAQADGESPHHARMMLSKVHQAMSRIEHHVQEPGHVAPEAIDELRTKLEDLQTRVRLADSVISARR